MNYWTKSKIRRILLRIGNNNDKEEDYQHQLRRHNNKIMNNRNNPLLQQRRRRRLTNGGVVGSSVDLSFLIKTSLLTFLVVVLSSTNCNNLSVSSFLLFVPSYHHHKNHRRQRQQQQIIQQWHPKQPVASSSSSSSSSLITTSRTYSSSTSTSLMMCQLLGMNCATPTDFTFSFSGFCSRGGLTDIHQDGWGLAIYQDSGLRQFHDVEPASISSLAKFLSTTPIKTQNMMGHIRYATQGSVDMSNVHPFCREMWGIQWCFAHNGEVPLYSLETQSSDDDDSQARILMSLIDYDDDLDHDDDNNDSCCYQQFYHPIGSTDSEATFCAILNALRNKFRSLPSLPVLYEAISKLCTEIVSYDKKHTILNFLLTCGQHTQWVYSHPGSRPGSKVWNGLYYTTRQYPFNEVRLSDIDYTVDFSTCTTSDDCVSVIATSPLTNDEQWIELSKGELLLFDNGQPQKTIKDLFRVELSGHGLNSTVLDPPQLSRDFKKFSVDPIELDYFQGHGI